MFVVKCATLQSFNNLQICKPIKALNRRILCNSNTLEHTRNDPGGAMATTVSLIRLPLPSRFMLNSCIIAEQAARTFHCAPVVCSDQDSEQRMTLREIERNKRQERNRTAGYLRRKQRAYVQPKASIKPSDFNANIEWSSVFQTARPYDPYLIPIPICMGRQEKGELPSPALNNAELLKIPNFFHLTPPAVMKHCAALKPLCTKWVPEMERLPLKITTKTVAFSGRSLYHPGSRVVILTINLKHLRLAKQAKKKFIELAGSRYNAKTNELKLLGDQCPARHQNQQHVLYLLKVLYLEANKADPPSELETDDTRLNESRTSAKA